MRQLFKLFIQHRSLVDPYLPERIKNALAGTDWKVRLSQLEQSDYRVSRAMSRSLLVRHLDVGSSNGEEAELVSLSTAPVYDLARFGIEFTASPRHADVLAVTGSVTRHLKIAMERTYAATPHPKIVLAIGDAACNMGVFEQTYACLGPVSNFFETALGVRGNPPEPEEILKGLLLCKVVLSQDSHC